MPTTNPMTKAAIDAEAAFAKKAFRQRAELNEKARKAIASTAVTRPVTIRLSEVMLAIAKQQAQNKGLPYQTYMKMLLHEALANANR